MDNENLNNENNVEQSLASTRCFVCRKPLDANRICWNADYPPGTGQHCPMYGVPQ